MNTGEAQQGPDVLQPAASARQNLPQPPEFENTGQRVAWLREFHGLSLQDFGRRIGYDGSQISRIERSRCHVVDRFIRVVCIQFRVQESWLRLGTGPAMLPPGLGGEAQDAGSTSLERAEESSQKVETLVISSQEWEEAWKDLRSYVEFLDKLSPVARAELAGKLHQLVTRVCAADDADGMITISARLRENDDTEAAPSTADGPPPVSSKGASGKPRSMRKPPPTGEDSWKFPTFPVSV